MGCPKAARDGLDVTSLSRRLAAHVESVRYEDLPAAAIDGAKRSLLDAIGVSLGASGAGEGCAAFAAQARSAGGAPESSVFGYEFRAPAQLAALANGAMAHALDFEDAFDAAPVHPNAALIPAALALGEARGDVDGRALLTAMAVGCDLTCRLALAVRTPVESFGWYPPPIFGAYGAVAAAGRIVGLDAQQMLDAFSLALCQATCSGEIKHAPDSVLRSVRDAFASQTGVLSAQLASRGVRGFERPFEGECGFFRLYAQGDYDEDKLMADLGARFYGAELSYKAWPSCRGTHAAAEAALALRAVHDFAASDVVRIETEGGLLQEMLARPIETKRAPRTAIDAKFSLPFVVATAIVKGRVSLDDFDGPALCDGAVLALAARCEHRTTEEWARNAAGGRLAIHLRDGRTLMHAVEAPLGAPSNPIAWDALVEKAIACAARAHRPAPPAAIARLAERIATLEAEPNAAGAIFAELASG
ncbi:MAG: MmgE/PrpD family protein [Hyphomonadaceae bacterium]|nr:MmgE/PrpD family protein [Hyphomonadaceae bacterium]